RCDFCQNFDISFKKGFSAEKESKKLGVVSPKDFVQQARNKKARSIAFTYNEPSISVEYNLEAIKEAKKTGDKIPAKEKRLSNEKKLPEKEKPSEEKKLSSDNTVLPLGTVYVSNGYTSNEQIKALTKKGTKLDAINIDLKSFSDSFYNSTCGAKLEKVLEGIKDFHKEGVWVELTTLVIPGLNDSNSELQKIAEWIYSVDKNIPWHISAFFPMHKFHALPPTSKDDILRAAKIGKNAGLNFVYSGNTTGTGFEDTFCPSCGKVLIKRAGFDSGIDGINKGKCIFCGEKIRGMFDYD
ncbi:MAG: radical SAM protein, partial [Candidatus Diapherotrites archaeon]|nr:radical SAM protein [Candidatus Diapherotrites archaeon]